MNLSGIMLIMQSIVKNLNFTNTLTWILTAAGIASGFTALASFFILFVDIIQGTTRIIVCGYENPILAALCIFVGLIFFFIFLISTKRIALKIATFLVPIKEQAVVINNGPDDVYPTVQAPTSTGIKIFTAFIQCLTTILVALPGIKLAYLEFTKNTQINLFGNSVEITKGPSFNEKVLWVDNLRNTYLQSSNHNTDMWSRVIDKLPLENFTTLEDISSYILAKVQTVDYEELVEKTRIRAELLEIANRQPEPVSRSVLGHVWDGTTYVASAIYNFACNHPYLTGAVVVAIAGCGAYYVTAKVIAVTDSLPCSSAEQVKALDLASQTAEVASKTAEALDLASQTAEALDYLDQVVTDLQILVNEQVKTLSQNADVAYQKVDEISARVDDLNQTFTDFQAVQTVIHEQLKALRLASQTAEVASKTADEISARVAYLDQVVTDFQAVQIVVNEQVKTLHLASQTADVAPKTADVAPKTANKISERIDYIDQIFTDFQTLQIAVNTSTNKAFGQLSDKLDEVITVTNEVTERVENNNLAELTELNDLTEKVESNREAIAGIINLLHDSKVASLILEGSANINALERKTDATTAALGADVTNLTTAVAKLTTDLNLLQTTVEALNQLNGII